MSQYYSIVTTIGTQKIASSITTGTKLNLVTLVIGDGNGSYYEPSVKQTKLKNEAYRCGINSIKINPLNLNWLTIEAIIPAAIGGFYIREVGVLDSEGILVAVGKYCETYKPLPSEGTSKELIIELVIDADNAESVSLSVNGDISTVTQDEFKSHIHNVNHVFYSVATGSANNYLASVEGITEYFDGLAVCAKMNSASTGASTLNVNGLGAKQILDSLGNPITTGGLKVGLPYTLRYNGTNFIVQGKGGGGDATAAQLLLGKKATVDTGPIIGTLDLTNLVTANIKSGVTINGVTGKSTVVDTADGTASATDILNTKTSYVNGSKVIGSIPNLTGTRSATGVGKWGDGALAVYPEKGYQKGGAGDGEIKVSVSQLQSVNPDFVSDNIKAGKNIFGIGGKSTVVDTADAVLDPSYLAQGYSGYDDGVKKDGTMPSNPGLIGGTNHIQSGAGVTVGNYSPDGQRRIYVRPGSPGGRQCIDGDVWITQLAGDLSTENIISGRSILGIGGTASIASLGGKRYMSGSFTLNAGATTTITAPFNIRVAFVNNSAIYYKGFWSSTPVTMGLGGAVPTVSGTSLTLRSTSINAVTYYYELFE